MGRAQGRQEHVLPHRLPLRRRSRLPSPRRGRVPHHLRDEGLHRALAGVLPDLYGQHLGRVHLLVQELDDPPQFGGDDVGHEDQPHSPGQEVRLHRLPEHPRVRTTEELGQGGGRGPPAGLAPGLEPGLDAVGRPVEHGVGGVVEQLPDDLAADAGVGRPLDLDEGGDAILVEEQVVEGPAVGAVGLAGDADLAVDEEPPAGLGRVDLVAGQETGVLGQEPLEQVLGGVPLLPHLVEPAVVVEEEDAAAHGSL